MLEVVEVGLQGLIIILGIISYYDYMACGSIIIAYILNLLVL